MGFNFYIPIYNYNLGYNMNKLLSGVDDAESECDLDDYSVWDWNVHNSKCDDCNDFINEITDYALTV